MAGHVVESFLHDAIDVNCWRSSDWKCLPEFFVSDLNARLPFYRRQIPVQRAFQALLVEHHRMQRLRKAAHGIQRVLRDLPHLVQIGPEWRIFRRLLLSASQHRAHRGQHLAKFVVQFARDIAQRRLLCGDQLLRQIAALGGKARQLRKEPTVRVH